jgi:hypothetical protein
LGVISNGGDVNEFLKDVPDEFYKKVKDYADTLKYGFYQVSEHCGKAHDYFRYGKYGDREVEPTKKEYAEHVMTNSSTISFCYVCNVGRKTIR